MCLKAKYIINFVIIQSMLLWGCGSRESDENGTSIDENSEEDGEGSGEESPSDNDESDNDKSDNDKSDNDDKNDNDGDQDKDKDELDDNESDNLDDDESALEESDEEESDEDPDLPSEEETAEESDNNNVDSDVGSDSDTDVDSDSDTDTDGDSDSDTEAASDSDFDTDADDDSASDSESDTGSEDDSQSEIDTSEGTEESTSEDTADTEEEDSETSSEWDTYPEKGDGLAMTPPMGWNSWNCFHGDIEQDQIRQIADAMVSSGMKDVGYEYINIDDKWMSDDGRDQDGNLVPHPVRFSRGIKDLADYIHSLGLKLGIYGDRGYTTCSEVPESGSYGYEEQDAQTWADWGVDYLKYDNCALPTGRDTNEAAQEDYEKMAAALRATGRPMVFSLCAWGWKGEWMIEAGHLWRSTGDISDCWSNASSCPERKEWENGIIDIIDQNVDMAQYAGPGHWNDPDMLEVGNGHLTNIEYRAHFSIWAIMAAPLIAGNDLRNMDDETLAILTNTEVIAVDQDPAGIQGQRIVKNGDLEVWMKPLGRPDGPQKAVVLFNRGSSSAEISVDLADIGITGAADARDLWAHEDIGEQMDVFSADVESHGVVMVKFTQK